MSRLQAEKREVPTEFDRVSRSYDLLSGLNPGYEKHLRMSAERLQLGPGARVLDLCCGTGLSTGALMEVYPDAVVTGMDASAGMLEIARSKPGPSSVDATLLTEDDVTLRNVPDPDACLERLLPLLAPGGTLCLHEYSVAGSLWSRVVWNVVMFGIVIPLALVLARTTKIFRYLRRSVLDFDSVSQLEERLRRAGFGNVRTKPMDGWQRGVVHSFLAERGS